MGSWLASLSLPALLGAVAGFFIGLGALSSALGLLCERLFASRRIWAVPLDPGQIRFELIGNLAYLGVQIVGFALALWLGWLHLADGSWFSAWLTFMVMFVGFQVLYYWLHWAMHRRSWVRFHRWHHRSRVTTPFSGMSMSVAEAIGWWFCYMIPALAYMLFAPLSAAGLIAYLGFNVFGNVFGHSNFDPTLALSRSRAVSIFSPPFVFHALHHARWTGHYGFGSTMMDGLLGTEFPDWQAVHARVLAHRPLESLKTRAEGE